MKKAYILTALTVWALVLFGFVAHRAIFPPEEERSIKIGFLYVGDSVTPYTDNFVKAKENVEEIYGDRVEVVEKFNVPEDDVEPSLQNLVDEGCDLIFSTSFGYGETVKQFAEKYPEIEFCQATCYDANVEPVLNNYHNYMGEIYQGRYVTGVVAGLKLKEMIDEGIITPEQAKIGYVAAYPYAEVISGYTSFFMGVRSVVPEATMLVKYTNTWSGYAIEKSTATELIDMGCVIISQHSDTTGPAVACENADKEVPIYHVAYNDSMTDIAPTSSLVCCSINYEPYIESAVRAVLEEKPIESVVDARIIGQDASAGFDKNWVRILDINDTIVAEGTREKVYETIEKLKKGEITVFKGPYTAVSPYDSSDTIDLSQGYVENEKTSAPTFYYILDDVITIVE